MWNLLKKLFDRPEWVYTGNNGWDIISTAKVDDAIITKERRFYEYIDMKSGVTVKKYARETRVMRQDRYSKHMVSQYT